MLGKASISIEFQRDRDERNYRICSDTNGKLSFLYRIMRNNMKKSRLIP